MPEQELITLLLGPPDPAIIDALAAYWAVPGPFKLEDLPRMKRALIAGYETMIGSSRMGAVLPLRNFTTRDLEKAVAGIRRIAPPGSDMDRNADVLAKVVMRALALP